MKRKNALLALSVACALFPLHNALAAPSQSLEQRVSELEAQLAQTKQEVQDNKEQSDTLQSIADGFQFFGYARSGLNIDQDGHGAGGGLNNIGPQMSIGSNVGAFFGRLGLEDDTYVDTNLAHSSMADNGTRSYYRVMFSEGEESENAWHDANVNIRQVYVELSDIAAFQDSEAFRGSTLWAGRRHDRENFNIEFIDSDVIYLAGTGGGIYDVKMADNWTSNFSLVANDYSDLPEGTRTPENDDMEAYTLTWNNHFGPLQVMLNGIVSKDNDNRSTTEDIADTGEHIFINYNGTSFYGLSDGWTKTGMMYGHGLGAEVKNLGQDSNLTSDASSVRFFTNGVTRLSDNWRIGPSLLTEYSKDRYAEGDEYKWAVVNVRLAQEFNPNFEIAYETTYQYLDLDNGSDSVNGSVGKLTVAPTFKMSNAGGFFERPQIRFAVTYVNWSSDFKDSYLINGIDQGMGENKETVFAIQMETWF
ncbi:carbohydrate porin [Vibrio palustris]|uniref:Sucrose porin n=1 Tax=Vibrio palustris TaxID=1918946 RepID=A0A1R4B5J7_9VIBR|nr:carbohydrate porin [Vibrio palustris]SJL84185.1 Sucrose porin precursor [Vibrio palustris]